MAHPVVCVTAFSLCVENSYFTVRSLQKQAIVFPSNVDHCFFICLYARSSINLIDSPGWIVMKLWEVMPFKQPIWAGRRFRGGIIVCLYDVLHHRLWNVMTRPTGTMYFSPLWYHFQNDIDCWCFHQNAMLSGPFSGAFARIFLFLQIWKTCWVNSYTMTGRPS